MKHRLASGVLAGALALFAWALAPRVDAAELAYVRLTDGYWQVWSYDLESAQHRQLTASAFDKRRPVWGPAGALLYRSSNDELYLRSPEGSSETPWRRDAWPAGDPAWSPDGTLWAVARLRTELRDASALWLLGPGPEERRVLTPGPGLRMHAAWAPDGKALVYIRSFGSRGTQLRRLELASGRDEVLHEGGSHSAYPDVSPDGAMLAFASDRSGDYEIFVRELASGAERRLTDRPGLDTHPAWSPDGARIAHTSLREGRLEIWSLRPDGTDARPLFTIESDAQDPSWR